MAASTVYLFISSLLSVPLLFLICFYQSDVYAFHSSDIWLPALYAVFYSATLVLTMSAVKFGSLTVYMVYISVGMVFIPLLYGVFFLNESINAIKGVCIGLSVLICLIPLFAEKRQGSGKKTKKVYYLICILAMITNAMVIVLSKMREVYCPSMQPDEYTFLSKVAVTLISAVAFVYFLFKKTGREKICSCIKVKSSVYILLDALLGIGNLLFLNISVSMMNISVQSPLFSGFVLITTALADRLFFKAKITFNTLLCLVLSVVTVVLFAFTV